METGYWDLDDDIHAREPSGHRWADNDDDDGPQIHFWSVDDETGEVEDVPDYGTCCICGKGRQDAVWVRNFLILHRRSLKPGSGWGCVVCGLPADSAMAVICDGCLEGYAGGTLALRFVIDERQGKYGRAPIESLSDEPFDHDLSKHPEEHHAP